MSDTTFEALLTGQLQQYAEAGVRPIDRDAIAEATIATGRRVSWSLRPFSLGRRALGLAILGLLLVALAASVAMVGGSWLARDPARSELDPSAIIRPTPMAITYAGEFQSTLPGVDAGLPYPPRAAALADGRAIFLSDQNDIDIWDPMTGQLEIAGHTIMPRTTGAEFVPLADGRVLIIGGDLGPVDPASGASHPGISTAESFDPTDGTSRMVGAMTTSRWIFATAGLPDGRVLISGGDPVDGTPDVGPTLASAEVYDPATDSFTLTGPMSTPRSGHRMASLPDGRVLVVGGRTADLYDPSTGTFTPTGSPTDDFSAVTAMLDGRVLGIHGFCAEIQTVDGVTHVSEGWAPVSSEIYDPATGMFGPGPRLPHCVDTAIGLPNGEVFVEGFWRGIDPTDTSKAALPSWSGLYDPTTGAIRLTDHPDRYRPKAIALTDGTILLVGGVGLVEEGDHIAPSWAQSYR